MPINFPSTNLIANTTTYTFGSKTWIWNGQAWDIVTPTAQGLQGPQGVQGTTGSQGTTGIQGGTGSQGSTGSQGVTGSQIGRAHV